MVRYSGLAAPIFAAKGETPALARALDWSSTRLGAPETWPQSFDFSFSPIQDEDGTIAGGKRAERARLSHLYFVESMDRINRAIQGTNDLQQMMSDVLEATLSIFGCDRAWLFYPCDPEAPSFRVPMEIARPEYPGAKILNVDAPMPQDMARNLREALDTADPVFYVAGTERPINKVSAELFGVKSMLLVALYPKSGKPWAFGLHQCSTARVWTKEEIRIFKEISCRTADGLSSLLFLYDLKKSEQRYRLVFENSPVSLWEEDFSRVKARLDDLRNNGVTDIESYLSQHPEVIAQCVDLVTIINVNQAALTLHEASEREDLLAGLTSTFTWETFDTFREALVCLWNGETEMTKDTVVRTVTGDFRNVTVYFSVCPGYEETLSKIIVSLTDITESKRAAEEILSLNRGLEKRVADRTAELEAMNKELETFAYSVSHDLRTPLRAIDGFSRMLLEDYNGRLDEDGQHYLNTIRHGAIRMGQLIDDILNFSRLSQWEIDMAAVDIGALTREVFDELAAGAPERNISLHIGELPPARADPAMIRQVLANLLGNAIKFTGQRVEAVIEAGGAAEGTENAYWIRDNGAGFDMSCADRLFSVFQRLHSSQEFEGTGIGLAIVKRIVERHGGRVWAESKVGEGTTMHFTLPAAPV
jgi:signal transduction histidine kinase